MYPEKHLQAPIQELIDAFSRLGIEVQFGDLSQDDINAKGGLARVREKKVIIIHSGLSERERAELLINELKSMDLNDIFLSPRLRQALGLPYAEDDE